jgi:hypothetical protein
MHKTIPLILAGLAILPGCASIVSGQNQSVSVETRHKGAAIAGANCKLSNDKGAWFVTTPGSTVVHRSAEDLAVRCEKEGLQPGIASVKSNTKGMAFGNIIFGGIVGAGVDIASGAAFDYPPLFSVEMGDSILIAPPQPETAEKTSSAAPCGREPC